MIPAMWTGIQVVHHVRVGYAFVTIMSDAFKADVRVGRHRPAYQTFEVVIEIVNLLPGP